ncbi:translocan of the chloroplast inner membrane protein (nucleomorph) [Lotharella oceanica]|uniref:Translocan of the chloroplast inner membrane protein n=1 Tax=Lotharella oceanica TaxID=641309 RepID=A0A060DA70_9EUKA|nr:translocan of the chloroplast inner membrane protein [Lotharella oceanica]
MRINNIKIINNTTLLNNKNLYNLSKIKYKNYKIINTSNKKKNKKKEYFDAQEQKKKDMVYKFTNILTPVAYIPTLLFPVLMCRDVINNFPINLIIYKFIMPIQNAVSSNFLLYMAAWICYYYVFCSCNNFGIRFRHHANYGNEMEIVFNGITFLFYIIGDVLRWTFLSPIVLSFSYSILIGQVVYYVYYGLSYKFPHAPEIHYQVLSPPYDPKKRY